MNIRVAGLSHLNSDGTSRQEYLCFCKVGEEMILLRDARNPYDPNAIKVCRQNGQQIGFIPKDLAIKFAAEMDRGEEFAVVITEITGHDELGFRRVHIDLNPAVAS